MKKARIEKAQTYTKQQFAESQQFSPLKKDVLQALLEDKEYTIEQAYQIIEQFEQGVVL
ncbi:hypothetical protein NV379_23270 [Paenibacillus sp. N1-5-1-14]|uniref:hypothetical protein n=1 Tax=Paenibacillus radicibacter TaxID=2972488 RepID=UPI00215974E3|nr:hypothetical protein [Paenibacillus radicibacter]MCR8645563.1 hypothetical protein [Paenibacillus radicibacter]